MTDAPFPPTCAADIEAYDIDEVVKGYRAHTVDAFDQLPGDNHSPAFRWGWMNRRRDCILYDDGYDFLRREHIRLYGVPFVRPRILH